MTFAKNITQENPERKKETYNHNKKRSWKKAATKENIREEEFEEATRKIKKAEASEGDNIDPEMVK